MQTQETKQAYLTFDLGGELFAISVFKVVEIIEYPEVTRVPNAPEYLLGIINLRGNVIPLIDTRQKFAMNTVQNKSDQSVIIMELLMEGEKIVVGGLVDDVLDVIELSTDQVKPYPSLGSKYKPIFVLGMGTLLDKFYMLIDIDSVFSTEEIILLKENNSND